MCHKPHALRACRQFKRMPAKLRKGKAEELGYCTNCLAKSHKRFNCTSKIRCHLCKRKHHTMLHFNKATAKDKPHGNGARNVKAELISTNQKASTKAKRATKSNSVSSSLPSTDAREIIKAKSSRRSPSNSNASSTLSLSTSSISNGSNNNTHQLHQMQPPIVTNPSNGPELLQNAIETLIVLKTIFAHSATRAGC